MAELKYKYRPDGDWQTHVYSPKGEHDTVVHGFNSHEEFKDHVKKNPDGHFEVKVEDGVRHIHPHTGTPNFQSQGLHHYYERAEDYRVVKGK